MKQFLGTIIAFGIVFISHAQYTIKGHVLSRQNNEAVESATVSLQKNGVTLASQSTDEKGSYLFAELRKRELMRYWLSMLVCRKKQLQ